MTHGETHHESFEPPNRNRKRKLALLTKPTTNNFIENPLQTLLPVRTHHKPNLFQRLNPQRHRCGPLQPRVGVQLINEVTYMYSQ